MAQATTTSISPLKSGAPASWRALLEPYQLGSATLQNRFAMSAMTRYFTPRNVPGPLNGDYYTRRAVDGLGLLIAEGTYVDQPSAGGSEDVPRISAATVESWRDHVIAPVHAAGGKIFCQLWHVGGGEGDLPDNEAVSPSGVEVTAISRHVEKPSHPRPLTVTEIQETIAAFVRSAACAKQAGFDGIEIHAGHGYLIDTFLWPVTNLRNDQYGGNAANRARLSVEIISAIRAEVGVDFPIVYRYSQWKIGAYEARIAASPDELAELLVPISEAGVTAFDASTRRFWIPAFDGSERTLAGVTKDVTGKPAIAVGSVGMADPLITLGQTADTTDLEIVGEHFAKGEFDIVAMARAVLSNPRWLTKQRRGEAAELRPYALAHEDELI